MATTRFNNNILEAARRLHDPRTDATSGGDAGKRYSSAILSGYQNRAIRELILEKYQAVGSRIADLMPEIVKEDSPVSLGATFTVASDVWIPLALFTSTVPFTLVNDSRAIAKLATGRDALRTPSSKDPYAYMTGTVMHCLGLTAGGATFRYVKQPADVVPSNTVSTSSQLDFNGDAQGITGSIGAVATDIAGLKTFESTRLTSFTSADLGKRIVIWDGSNFYYSNIGTIETISKVGLSGGNVPATVAQVKMFILEPDPSSNDIEIAKVWDNDIVNRMVAMGVQDAKSGIAVG